MSCVNHLRAKDFFGQAIKINNIYAFILAMPFLLLSACEFKETKTSAGSDRIPAGLKTLIQDRCVKCHSGASASAGLSFVDDQDKLVAAGLIIPGNAEESVFYEKLTAYPPYGDRMPKDGQYLSESELAAVADWINSIGVSAAVAITTPSNSSFIDASNNSASFAVSGNCNIKGSTITLSINGTALSSTSTCDGSNFSFTVDTTASPFADGVNQLVANMTKASIGLNLDSSIVSVTKDLNALSIALTSPVNSGSTYRTTSQSDPSLITDSNDSAYTITGSCNSAGRPVSLEVDDVALGSGSTCDGSSFSITQDMSSVADGTHKLTVKMSNALATTTVSSSAFIYKWAATPTVSWSTQIRPMFTNVISGNSNACIDCHYSDGDGKGSANFTMGYFSGLYDSSTGFGSKPSPVNQTDRDAFVFQFGYFNNSTNDTSTNDAVYSKGFPVVNDSTASANSVRNRIVRGNPDQSFVYKKLTGLNVLLADGTKSRTKPSEASNKQMPNNGPNYFNTTEQNLMRQWILEGTRTDN